MCVECKDGFAKEHSGYHQCVPCPRCSEHQEETVACTLYSLRQCGDCKDGYGKSPDESQCLLCIPCPVTGRPLLGIGCPKDKGCLLSGPQRPSGQAKNSTPAVGHSVATPSLLTETGQAHGDTERSTPAYKHRTEESQTPVTGSSSAAMPSSEPGGRQSPRGTGGSKRQVAVVVAVVVAVAFAIAVIGAVWWYCREKRKTPRKFSVCPLLPSNEGLPVSEGHANVSFSRELISNGAGVSTDSSPVSMAYNKSFTANIAAASNPATSNAAPVSPAGATPAAGTLPTAAGTFPAAGGTTPTAVIPATASASTADAITSSLTATSSGAANAASSVPFSVEDPMLLERELGYDEVNARIDLRWPIPHCQSVIPDVSFNETLISSYRYLIHGLLKNVEKRELQDFVGKICSPSTFLVQVKDGAGCLERILSDKTDMKLATMVYMTYRMSRAGQNTFVRIVKVFHDNHCSCVADNVAS